MPLDTAGRSRSHMWMIFGHCRAVTAPHVDTLALFLNGEPIVCSPPVTGKSPR